VSAAPFGSERGEGMPDAEMTLAKWDAMGDRERVELYRSDPTTWAAMIDAQRQRGEDRLAGGNR
jgi:hypothetical protein